MKKNIIVFTLILIFTVVAVNAQVQRKEMKMSLKDCLIHALENNQDIALAYLEPGLNDINIIEAREKYFPSLSLNYYNYKQINRSTSGLEGDKYKFNSNNLVFQLTKKFSTGGIVSLDINNSKSDSERKYVTINPSFSSNISLNIRQPLLQGFGSKINNIQILDAKINKEIVVYGIKSQIQSKIFEIEGTYWNLVYQINRLNVEIAGLKQSRDQLIKVDDGMRIGVKSGSDVIGLEKEVARSEDSVIQIQNQVEFYEDQLKKHLNFKLDLYKNLISIVPKDSPLLEENKISFEEALDIALSNSSKLAQFSKELELNNLNIGYQKNQLLPKVDLNFNIIFPGQSGTQLIYENNNVLTNNVIDKIEGSRWDSIRESLQGKYNNLRVTLNFSLPLANIFSRASLARARAGNEKKALEIDIEKRTIENDLIQIYKNLASFKKRIDSSARFRKMAEKQVDLTREKYESGLISDNKWLLLDRRELTNIRIQEKKATIDYITEMAKLANILGTNISRYELTYKNFN